MLVGGLNIVRQAVADEFPLLEGMGNAGFSEFVCPVTLEGNGLQVRLASDPIIAVSRQNEIAKRSVAKPRMRGSVKESWAVGDWDVNLSGVIIAESQDELERQIRELTEICAVRESVSVTCPPLNDLYDITKLAIRSIQFPATPGECNQQFNISAYSDESYELLEEL